MKTMLLSFRPDVYQKIKKGEKLYEYRRVFPNEPVKAYMYVSRPVSAITGIIYLGKRHDLNGWLQEFSYDPEASERIREYMKKVNYAMEILEFQETSSIPLQQLRDSVKDFVVPQMYYYLDNHPLLDYIEKNMEYGIINVKNDFSTIKSSQVCRH